MFNVIRHVRMARTKESDSATTKKCRRRKIYRRSAEIDTVKQTNKLRNRYTELYINTRAHSTNIHNVDPHFWIWTILIFQRHAQEFYYNSNSLQLTRRNQGIRLKRIPKPKITRYHFVNMNIIASILNAIASTVAKPTHDQLNIYDDRAVNMPLFCLTASIRIKLKIFHSKKFSVIYILWWSHLIECRISL